MFYKVKNVIPKDDYMLHVEFENGLTKMYDVKNLFDKFEVFENVKVDSGGYGISWNDGLDLSCNELYCNYSQSTPKFTQPDCLNSN